MTRLITTVLLSILFCSPAGAADAFRWIEPIGEFKEQLTGMALSSDGTALAGTHDVFNPTIRTGFYWSESTGTLKLPDSTLDARAISPDGLTVVGRIRDEPGIYRWTPDGGIDTFDVALFPYATNGETVVGSGGIWTEDGGLVPLEGDPAILGMTDDASTIVGFTGENPFVYDGTLMPLPFPGSATGISPNGNYVIGELFPSPTAANQDFLLDRSTGETTILPDFRASDVSDDGILVGYVRSTHNGSVWTSQTGAVPVAEYVGQPDLALGQPFGISADGTIIAGTGLPDPNGRGLPWIVDLSTEMLPPAFTLVQDMTAPVESLIQAAYSPGTPLVSAAVPEPSTLGGALLCVILLLLKAFYSR